MKFWISFGSSLNCLPICFYEVQCVLQEVLLFHRTLIHCEWVVVVLVMEMCWVLQFNLQEIPNFVMRLAEVQIRNFILMNQKLTTFIVLQKVESPNMGDAIWEILRLGLAIWIVTIQLNNVIALLAASVLLPTACLLVMVLLKLFSTSNICSMSLIYSNRGPVILRQKFQDRPGSVVMKRVPAIMFEGHGSEMLEYISQEKITIMEFMESLHLDKCLHLFCVLIMITRDVWLS